MLEEVARTWGPRGLDAAQRPPMFVGAPPAAADPSSGGPASAIGEKSARGDRPPPSAEPEDRPIIDAFMSAEPWDRPRAPGEDPPEP